jgi:hypothetical protein
LAVHLEETLGQVRGGHVEACEVAPAAPERRGELGYDRVEILGRDVVQQIGKDLERARDVWRLDRVVDVKSRSVGQGLAVARIELERQLPDRAPSHDLSDRSLGDLDAGVQGDIGGDRSLVVERNLVDRTDHDPTHRYVVARRQSRGVGEVRVHRLPRPVLKDQVLGPHVDQRERRDQEHR